MSGSGGDRDPDEPPPGETAAAISGGETIEDEDAAAERTREIVEKRRYKGAPRSAKTELRARALIAFRIRNISMRYEDLLAWAMKEFDCGRTTASEVYKHSQTILAMQWKEGDPADAEMVAMLYLDLAEQARAAGKFNAAGLQLERYVRLRGLGVPDRMQRPAGSTFEEDMADLDDTELEVMMKVARRREERIRRAGTAADPDDGSPNPNTEH